MHAAFKAGEFITQIALQEISICDAPSFLTLTPEDFFGRFYESVEEMNEIISRTMLIRRKTTSAFSVCCWGCLSFLMIL